MKVVTWKNIEWHVYEGRNEFKEDYPDVEFATSLRDVEEGGWIESVNGFIVPCVTKRYYEVKKDGKGNIRKTPIGKWFFVFPRVKKFYYEKDLDSKPLYFPTTVNGLYNSDPYDSKVLHKPKNKLFALGVKEGLPIEVAYTNAFGQWKRGHATYLLQHKDISGFIFHDNERLENMRQELQDAGITKESLATKIATIINDEKPNPTILKWALETAMTILEDKQLQDISPIFAASMMINESSSRIHLKSTELGRLQPATVDNQATQDGESG